MKDSNHTCNETATPARPAGTASRGRRSPGSRWRAKRGTSEARRGRARSRGLWGSPILHSYPPAPPPGATLSHCAQHGFAQRNACQRASGVAAMQRWRNEGATGPSFQEERTHAHEQTLEIIRGRDGGGTRWIAFYVCFSVGPTRTDIFLALYRATPMVSHPFVVQYIHV